MKTGLVMEGGAMRGLFTCGVIDVLLENGVRFDGAAGISAGAVFGCNFKSGQVGRALRYNKQYCADPRYCSIRSLIRTGDLYGADFCYRELPDELDVFDRNAFAANPMEFYAGATDAATGVCVYHRCEDGGDTDMLWLRASASMPLVSRPVEIDGPAAALPVMRLFLRRWPRLAEAMAVRHEMYNRQMEEISRRERDGISLVIRPPEALKIGHTEKNPAELDRVYQLGRREAAKRLPEICQFLEK